MPCDTLWIPRRKRGEFCLRTRGNEKYSSKEYRQIMFIPTLLIPPKPQTHKPSKYEEIKRRKCIRSWEPMTNKKKSR